MQAGDELVPALAAKRLLDLALDAAAEPPNPLPLIELAENESFLSALGKLGVARDACF